MTIIVNIIAIFINMFVIPNTNYRNFVAIAIYILINVIAHTVVNYS